MTQRLITALALTILLISPAKAQKKSDREEQGLVGPVRTLLVETESPGKARIKTEMVSFDASGNKIEEMKYSSDGALESRRVYSYDIKGNVIAETGYDAKGEIEWKNSYNYDGSGSKVEILSYSGDGKLAARTSYTYDASGKLSEESYRDIKDTRLDQTIKYTYDDKGHLLSKKSNRSWGPRSVDVTYIYDKRGLLIEEVDRDVITNTRHYIYDEKGRRVQEENGPFPREVIKLDDKGNPTARIIGSGSARIGSPLDSEETYEYEYDSHGNWVKQTRTRVVVKEVTQSATVGRVTEFPRLQRSSELEDVIYRTITYY